MLMVRDQDWARDGTRQKNGSSSRDEFAISIPISFRPETNSDFASPFLASRDDSDNPRISIIHRISSPVPISMWKKLGKIKFFIRLFFVRVISRWCKIFTYILQLIIESYDMVQIRVPKRDGTLFPRNSPGHDTLLNF